MTGLTDKSTAGKSTHAHGRIGAVKDPNMSGMTTGMSKKEEWGTEGGSGKAAGLGLNLASVKKVDFHDEFMSRINECS